MIYRPANICQMVRYDVYKIDNRNTLINVGKGSAGIRFSAVELDMVTQPDCDRPWKRSKTRAKLTYFRQKRAIQSHVTNPNLIPGNKQSVWQMQ